MLLAYTIAQKAHAGQVDKSGQDYMFHVIRVAEKFYGDDDMVSAALLHDVIEDSSITLSDLLSYGIGGNVVELVSILTRRDGETYQQFTQRISKSHRATLIKIADITDHLRDTSVLAASMVERYEKASKVLFAAEMGRESFR